MKLILVRHGQCEDNKKGLLNGHRDTPLTALGRQQAREAINKLKGIEIDAVYTSPLQRAKQTAFIIARGIGFSSKVIAHDFLIERDFGVMSGVSISDISRHISKEYILPRGEFTYFTKAEGSETYPNLIDRVGNLLEELRNTFPEGKVLVVAHGDVNDMIRAYINGWTWEEGLRAPHINNADVLEFEV